MTSNDFWRSKDPKIVIARAVIIIVAFTVIWVGVLGNDLPFDLGSKKLEVRGISAESVPLASDNMKLIKKGSTYEVIF